VSLCRTGLDNDTTAWYFYNNHSNNLLDIAPEYRLLLFDHGIQGLFIPLWVADERPEFPLAHPLSPEEYPRMQASTLLISKLFRAMLSFNRRNTALSFWRLLLFCFRFPSAPGPGAEGAMRMR